MSEGLSGRQYYTVRKREPGLRSLEIIEPKPLSLGQGVVFLGRSGFSEGTLSAKATAVLSPSLSSPGSAGLGPITRPVWAQPEPRLGAPCVGGDVQTRFILVVSSACPKEGPPVQIPSCVGARRRVCAAVRLCPSPPELGERSRAETWHIRALS